MALDGDYGLHRVDHACVPFGFAMGRALFSKEFARCDSGGGAVFYIYGRAVVIA